MQAGKDTLQMVYALHLKKMNTNIKWSSSK